MNAIIFECYLLTYTFLYTSGKIFFIGLKVTVYIYRGLNHLVPVMRLGVICFCVLNATINIEDTF
jgi:hypothetical protein